VRQIRDFTRASSKNCCRQCPGAQPRGSKQFRRTAQN
jgi:hypothetical protein